MTDNDLAGEIRQALEDITPAPWTLCCFEESSSKEWVINESTGLELAYIGDVFANGDQAEATAALIAAAPGLLARAADRIEALEAWKESATRILGAWDEVWVALGQPGPLGTSRAAASLAAIAEKGA